MKGMRRKRFALIGVAGFVAPRHLKAIQDTGNVLVAAVDPHDCVGVLDQYFPEVRFFPEIERFDRYLEKLRRQSDDERVDYVSICSPNYLHDAHVRMTLRVRADAICEKPLVINPWNLDALADLEQEFGRRVYTILQLRLHPALIALKEQIARESSATLRDVCLTYITFRGPWYHVSWKGSEERSGGLAMNIGIHFFDLLIWLFGKPSHVEVHAATPQRMAGLLELEHARVRWFLSVDRRDLPRECLATGKRAYRSITLDGQAIEFSESFTDLHTRVYEAILSGNGFGIADARPSVELVYAIRKQSVVPPRGLCHPLLSQ